MTASDAPGTRESEASQGRRLFGKVAVVTGGASGIGAATCRLFAREGASVIIADIDDELGRQVETEITDAGGEAVFRHLDVVNADDWVAAIEYAVERFGKLDVLVNNAGMSGPRARKTVEDTMDDDWNVVMDVNARSVFVGTKYAIPQMRKAGGGSIINVSSIYGNVGSKASTPYHASKGAVRTFTKAAAVQYAPEQIRVNSVHPGFTDTGMTRDIHAVPEIRKEREDKTPVGRLGVPEDIAWGIVYLASDESRFVTGAELVIDGGMTAQ